MANMSHLLGIPLGVGQLGGDMEHDLFVPEAAVDGFTPRLPVGHIQASPKTASTKMGSADQLGFSPFIAKLGRWG